MGLWKYIHNSRQINQINERNIGIGVLRPGRIHVAVSRMKAPGPKPSVLAPACSTSSEDEGALEGFLGLLHVESIGLFGLGSGMRVLP